MLDIIPSLTQEIHHLKIKKEHAVDITSGKKRFEIRLNDRNYQAGDLLILRPWHPERGFLAFFPIVAMVTLVSDFEQKEGYVVLGIKVYKPEERR